jgi:hypothetical protein
MKFLSTNKITALKLSAPFILATLGLITTAPAEASLIGKQMNAIYYVPDTSTQYGQAVFSPPTFTIGDGPETTGSVENVTTGLVDFTSDMLTITLSTSLTNPTWNVASFNGIIFTSLDSLGLASASVDPGTTMVGFDNSRVSFNDNQILINWNGLSYNTGTTVKVNFTSIPAPGPLPVLGAAAAFGFSRKLRKRIKATRTTVPTRPAG